MPFKKRVTARGRAYQKKRPTRMRRRHRRMNKNTTIQRGLPIADRSFVKLRYIDTTTPSLTISTLSLLSANTYYVNGLYDVNSTVGSTAIPGFAEWSGFYLNYRVRAVKMTVDFQNAGAEAVICGVHIPPLSTNFPSSWLNFMELQGNRRNKTKLISQAGGNDRCRLQIYVNLAKSFGNKMQWEVDDTSQGTKTSNPSALNEGWSYVLMPDGVAPAANVKVYVNTRITFYAEFFNRLTVYS